MAAKPSASVLPLFLLLLLNLLLFFALASACYTCPPKCPMDTLKLGVCANVLNGLIKVHLGKPPKEPCCSLLDGLVDLEAAVCLCTVLKAKALGGLKLGLPIDVILILNYCGKTAPTGFQCY